MDENLSPKINSAFPTARGLLPHELVILHEAPYCEIDNAVTGYPCNIIRNLCGIEHVETYFYDLRKRGFLDIGNIEQNIEHEFAYTLKEVCKSYGLKVSGTKAVLRHRLLSSLSQNKLAEIFPRKWYVLTQAGKCEMEENPYISLCIRKCIDGILLPDSIWKMNKLLAQNPNISPEKAWDCLAQDYISQDQPQHCNADNKLQDLEWETKASIQLDLFSKTIISEDRLAQLSLDDENSEHIDGPSIADICRKLDMLIFGSAPGDYFVILSDNMGNYIQSIATDDNCFTVEFHKQLGADPLKFHQKQAFDIDNNSSEISAATMISLFADFCVHSSCNDTNIKWIPIEVTCSEQIPDSSESDKESSFDSNLCREIDDGYSFLKLRKRAEDARKANDCLLLIQANTEILYHQMRGGLDDPQYRQYVLRYISDYLPYYFPYSSRGSLCAPGLIKEIRIAKKKSQLNDNALRSIISQVITAHELKWHLFTKEECIDSIMYELEGNSEEVSKIYNTAYIRIKEKGLSPNSQF